MKKIIFNIILIFILLQYSKVNSQSISIAKENVTNYHISEYATVEKNSSIDSFIILNRHLFKMGKYDQVQVYESSTDSYGWKHRKYNMYHKSIPIEGQNIIIQENPNGEITYIGAFVNNLDIDTNNKVSGSSVISNAYTNYNSKHSIPFSECIFNISQAIINTKPDQDNKVYNMRLIYIVEISNVDIVKPSLKYYLDAKTGNILFSFDKKCNVLQNVPTVHYGTKQIETQGRIVTDNLQNVCSIPSNTSFQIGYTTATNFNIDTVNNPKMIGISDGLNSGTINFGEANNLHSDSLRIAIQQSMNEAQYLTRKTLDMYSMRFGEPNFLKEDYLYKPCIVNGIEQLVYFSKKGFTISVPQTGNPLDLFIAGDKFLYVARVGRWLDTNKWNYVFENKYLVGADIISHEITHALNNKYGQLNPWLESGALAESFCDIMGYYFENWMYTNSSISKLPSWIVGDEVNLRSYNQFFKQNSNPSAIYARSMNTPLTYNDPAKYKGTYFKYQNCCTPAGDNDMCFIHSHNSIQNRWFFLCNSGMAAFGKATIPLDKIVNIVFDNLKYNMTKNASFLQARRGSLRSLDKIYGSDASYAQMKSTIMAAWDSVGVYDTANMIFVLNSIPGNNIINGNNKTYYVYSDIIIPTFHHVQFRDITLNFEDGVGIKTQIGGCLSSRKAKFTAMNNFDCDSLSPPLHWKGIDMEGYSDGYKNYDTCVNSYLASSFINNNPLHLGLDLSETIISYADTAIKSGTYWYPTDAIPSDYNAYYSSKKKTGCDIFLGTCRFINNKKDIFYVMDNFKSNYIRVLNSKFYNDFNNNTNLLGKRIEILNDYKHLNTKGIKDYLNSEFNQNLAEIIVNNNAKISFQYDTFDFPTYDYEVIYPSNLNTSIYCQLNMFKNRTFGQTKSCNIGGCYFKGGYKGIEMNNTIGAEIKYCTFDSVDYPIISNDYKNLIVSNTQFKNPFIALKLSNGNSSVNYLASKSDSTFFYTSISANTFEFPAYRAIEALTCRSMAISGNYIKNKFSRLYDLINRAYENSEKTYAPISNLKEMIGVNLLHCYKSKIDNNTFENVGNNPYFYFKYNDNTNSFDTIPLLYEAITITNNSKSKDYIYKNKFKDGWDIGIYSYGQNTGLSNRCNNFGTTNTPFNISAIYAKDNLRWQGCSDAYIQNPTPTGHPCRNVNDPAANTFSWTNCSLPDHAKMSLDSPYLNDFRYFTQQFDYSNNLTPFINNGLSSFCFNVPMGYDKNKLTNCASLKIEQSTCSDSAILSARSSGYTSEGDTVIKLKPICDFEPILVDRDYIKNRVLNVRAIGNFNEGIEGISKSTVLNNLRTQLAELDYEVLDMSERCRDSIRFYDIWNNSKSINIKLMNLEDRIIKKEYTSASSYLQATKLAVTLDSDYTSAIKQMYISELDQFTPLINALSQNESTDTLSSSTISALKSLSTEHTYKASSLAHQILADNCGGIYPLNVPSVPISANDRRWSYLATYQYSDNPFQFEIFPNPVSDVLEYSCELNPSLSNAKITLFSATNPTNYIVQNTIQERGSIHDQLYVSNLSSGLYIITLWVENVPTKSYTVQKE